ncbi:Aste57867_13719 [Aphanomyces stellatus]|uniref:Aste57867_13719 protein n=1 Tax=Aphanomyces stellatus TaxID=120398 RepID=A0A485KZK2_9STRA|nr:hypothetical protein As57867_013669 [Aphanomyces stellatus]VFT90552.1 Aste57867_13719 [Aphanomyces stellatus]
MWPALLALALHTAFITPHMTFQAPYWVVGGGAIVAYMYILFSAPREYNHHELTRSVAQDWCVRLFGKVPETKMRVWRNDAKFKLSTWGFGSVMLTGAVTYVLGDVLQWTPVAFAVMLAGTSIVIIIDELRYVITLMMENEKTRQKQE